jgi:hypothetical protein
MNYPAASCGVSEKTELLAVQLRVLGTLIFDVLLDALFIAVLPYRAHEIPITPELSSPELLLHFRAQPKDFSGGDTLDDLHDLLRTVHWHRLHQKVHVVFVCPYLDKRHIVPFADLQTCLLELLVHRWSKNHSTVLRRTNNMVQQY